MSDELFENDGKQVGTLRWPFKKYTILMPEKNDVDAFAWLFASFVRMYNRKKKNPEFTYNNDIENVVKGMIRQHFGNIIDVPTAWRHHHHTLVILPIRTAVTTFSLPTFLIY